MLTLVMGRQVWVVVVCERAGDPPVGSIDLADANITLLVQYLRHLLDQRVGG
ncbi:hypothetical protein ACFT4A_34995 [Streptomyces sp. NPDC057099]|uniref:hypothetical protein n=1 Tax=Streptomyces sp. NPDC057099 TaxID=3346019 RepID=UPI0036282080